MSKGSKPRPVNIKKYNENWDQINWKKEKEPPKTYKYEEYYDDEGVPYGTYTEEDKKDLPECSNGQEPCLQNK